MKEKSPTLFEFKEYDPALSFFGDSTELLKRRGYRVGESPWFDLGKTAFRDLMAEDDLDIQALESWILEQPSHKQKERRHDLQKPARGLIEQHTFDLLAQTERNLAAMRKMLKKDFTFKPADTLHTNFLIGEDAYLISDQDRDSTTLYLIEMSLRDETDKQTHQALEEMNLMYKGRDAGAELHRSGTIHFLPKKLDFFSNKGLLLAQEAIQAQQSAKGKANQAKKPDPGIANG